jgi:uncharacterized repeat protein (TIGR04138 family)
MPQHQRPEPVAKKTIDQVIEEQGLYPHEAFEFVRRGLTYTVEHVHATLTDPEASRHVSGQQLCEGLRQFALLQWGFLARTVLKRWKILRTEDFGKIVFTLVESGEMSSTDEDSIGDFRHVYDFAAAFDSAYRIETKSIENRS